MNSKITIIGAGNVGATIAYALTIRGAAGEIVLIDINKDKADGEAMDIRQGAAFVSNTIIHSGDYPDAFGSDIVILTSGMGRKPGQTRLDLAKTNTDITLSIIPQITKYAPDALYVIVSNPVDILTYVFSKKSDIPVERIIGSGTILDSARLHERLAAHYHVNPQNVNAHVLGEHGDSSFIPWSCIDIANVPAAKYNEYLLNQNIDFKRIDREDTIDYVRNSGGYIIKRKGATFYAVAVLVCFLCECLQSEQNTVQDLSTVLNGEYGISDVALSLPTIVSNVGVVNKIMLPLNTEEEAALHTSANKLKEIIAGLGL